MVRSIPQAPFLSLFAKSDRTRLDHSRSEQMVTAHVRKTYTEISHVLLTLHGDFNSMADKGA